MALQMLAAALASVVLMLMGAGFWCSRTQAEGIGQSSYENIAVAGVIVGALILLVASPIASAYSRRQTGLFRKLFEAERQKRETQERFRTILYSIGDAVITTDLESGVCTMNPMAEQLTGWTEAEAQGKPLDAVFRIVNQDTRVAVENPVATVLRSGRVVSLANHTVLIARDGTERSIADSAAPIRGGAGAMSGVVLVVSDVTEQYRVREALRRSEHDYRMLFEGILEGFALHEIICDGSGQPVDYRFLSINPAFEEMTGLCAAKAIGRTVREILPEIETTWIERYGRVALTGEPVRFEEYSGPLKRHFEVSAFRPQPNQFAVMFQDITARKAAEFRIARLSQLYAALSQCNQAIVHSTSVVELLPQICRDAVQFGGMKMAWIGLVDEDTGTIHPVASCGSGTDYLDGVRISVTIGEDSGRGPIGTSIRENQPFWCHDFLSDPRTAPWHERGAHYGWGAAAALPLCLKGKAVGALTLFSDKAEAFDEEMRKLLVEMAYDLSFALDHFANEDERKRAEEAVRRSEARLNFALETARTGAWELDLQDHTAYRTAIHDRIFGYETLLPNWTYEMFLEHVLPEDRPNVDRAFREATASQTNWNFECRIRRADGEVRWILAAGVHERNSEGKPVRMSGIVQDLTERKRMEEKLLQTERMESIGRLAAGVAHDLNNILTPILFSAEMLRTMKESEPCGGLIDTIEECARRGANVVNQVLTFARGAEGERTTLQLNRLIDEMERIMHETFPREIAVTCSIPPDLWPVAGNPTQVHQVLLNLCINSRDAMPNGGSLLISGENKEIDASFAATVPDATAGRYAMLAISDSGTGIPREIVGKIFDPFFTTKEIGKGTGLGLSTVIGIVRNHGGFVTVESAERLGSTFKVFLPAESGGTAKPKDALPIEAHRSGGEKILVVDDEVFVARVTSMALEHSGYRVLTATDGSEALALFEKHASEIQVVLTDVMMPGMDGVSLSRALKAIDPQVKIIASTGRTTETLQNELRALGIEAILHKPYDSKKLLETLRKAIVSDRRSG